MVIAKETQEAKQAFEKYSEERGIRIQGYHTNKGIFKAYKWVLACHMKGQGLTFAGVNTHHQNEMVERHIQLLQELPHTMLIHASKWWPNCITAKLWPYALLMANNV
jgi:hypothetical protein